MSIGEAASERQTRMLRKRGVLPLCEAELRAHGIEAWSLQTGGKHPHLVYEQAGIEHRYPIPGSGKTRGRAITNVVRNLRRKLEGRAAR